MNAHFLIDACRAAKIHRVRTRCFDSSVHTTKPILSVSSQTKPNDNDNQQPSASDDGASAAWGLMGGALVGALIGVFFGKAILGGFTVGVIGWIGGALIDRARR